MIFFPSSCKAIQVPPFDDISIGEAIWFFQWIRLCAEKLLGLAR